MINYKWLIGFLLIASTSYATTDQLIDTRLSKQMAFPRVLGWCVVPWKNQQFTGMILDLQEDRATVKIFDTEVLFSEWPIVIFPSEDLTPCVFEKRNDLEGLIGSLKLSNRLKTPVIESALRAIDRTWFCSEHPYYDVAIEIGHDMFISAPHMHILSLEICKDLFRDAKSILDVGSGSGYLTALFSQLAPHADIVGVEYFEDLIIGAEKAIAQHLPSELTHRIQFIPGNGEKGYPAKAPYDIIYVGFMCKEIPQDLVDQLSPGGRLLIPVGTKKSTHTEKCLGGSLLVIEKIPDGTLKKHEIFSCSFVPSVY